MVEIDLELDGNFFFKSSNNLSVLNVALRLAELPWVRLHKVDCNTICAIIHKKHLPFARPLFDSYSDGCVQYVPFPDDEEFVHVVFNVLPF